MKSLKNLVSVFALLGIVLGGFPAWGVSPYDDILVQKASKDLSQENYDEALAELTEAWQKGTHTAEKAYLLGQTYRLLVNYSKARGFLEEALRLKPNMPQAQLMLADTLIALDKPSDALPLLQALEATGYEPGQVAFLRGMAESKEGRYSAALDYFQKAAQDPKMAQEAKFQASLALVALNRLKEAQQSMEQSIAVNPQTQTADFAQRYMGVLEKRTEELRPFRASVAAGWDYDSNVTVQPGGTAAAAQPSGRGDQVFTQTATLEYNFNANQPFSLLAQYSYFQNFHPRIGSFDMMSHFVGVIPTYSYNAGRFWVPLSYNYVDVGSSKYFTGYIVNPILLHLFNENFGLEATGRFYWQYYWFPVYPHAAQETGTDFGCSLGAYYFFKKQTGFLQLRLNYDNFTTIGNNWDNNSYRLLLAALYPITEKLKVNIFVDLNLQPYNHFFFNGVGYEDKRHDETIITGLQITYNIWKSLDINAHYFYTRDKSNTSIYNYSRQIAGVQLGYRY
jgi:tetratricopeptide (TPR) repeat protein